MKNTGLYLDGLPPLPQSMRLARLAHRVWEREDVVALWVGGSLAAGNADVYSDVDVRVAVRPEALEGWRTADLQALFEGEMVGGNVFPFGEDAFLHHLALSSGDIFDFWVQSSDRDPAAEHLLILGCRDPEYRHRLEGVIPLPGEFPQAEGAAIRRAIVDFWINSLKHRKVLHRGLDLLAVTGIGMERALLLRLWHVQATGRDGGAARVTIHSLTQTIRAVESGLDTDAWYLRGGPLTTRADIVAAIKGIRDEVARVGRVLAGVYGFGYPDALEETVRRSGLGDAERASRTVPAGIGRVERELCGE